MLMGHFCLSFQKSFVNLAFDVGTDDIPTLFANQINQLIQFRRALNFVLAFGENLSENSFFVAEISQNLDIMNFERSTAKT